MTLAVCEDRDRGVKAERCGGASEELTSTVQAGSGGSGGGWTKMLTVERISGSL